MKAGKKTEKRIEQKINEWKSRKSYLNPHFTIATLSKEVGVNRTYLSNFINNRYSTNFNGWVNQMRIEEAKKSMRFAPKEALKDVATGVGFTDLAHFSKLFKSYEGTTPSKWKKQNEWRTTQG